jgi:hypothetical protein
MIKGIREHGRNEKGSFWVRGMRSRAAAHSNSTRTFASVWEALLAF